MAHSFDTEAKNKLQKLWWKLHSLRGYLLQKDFKNVETVLMFIGYPRSGHTLIGSMLDAHPEMVVAHELDALYYFQESFSLNQLFYLINQNAVNFTKQGRKWEGYHYSIPGQWQGKYQTLKVIGDKCGGRTSHRLKLAGSNKLIYDANKTCGGKLKLIHAIRNPFDNISTMVTRTAKRKGAKIGEPLLKRQMRFYFDRCKVINDIRKDGIIPVLDINQADFVKNTSTELKKILDFLNLNADPQYLKDCAGLVWDSPRKSRDKVKELWTEEMIDLVNSQMQSYDFFKGYSFQSA